jgi:hypothetical protein
MITGDQLALHLLGDYVLQSNWMAQRKTDEILPALIHATTYTLPFAFLGASVWALLVIGVTHFIIDHWRLARYVIWLRNMQSPNTERWRLSLEEYKKSEPRGMPNWLAAYLLFIADNTMHIFINGWALTYL